MAYATLADYLDSTPERRAQRDKLVALCDAFDARMLDPWGYAADADGFLCLTGRVRVTTGEMIDLDPPVTIHKADIDWLASLWEQADLFELDLWRAGIGVTPG